MELPTIRQLECLVAVADLLNFRKAAARCFITQPALSSQIRQLEIGVGLTLFERDRRRVLTTAAGLALAEKARRVLGEIREIADAARSFKEPLTGILKVGVIPTIAPYVLPRAVREARKRHPRLKLFLKEATTAELVREVRDGGLDIALLALEAELSDLETTPLAADAFLLAVPAHHRLAKRARVTESDLDGEDVLLLEDGHCLRHQVLDFCDRAGACELGDFRASSLTTLVQMVAGGTGVTLLPEVALAVEGRRDPALKLISFGAKGPRRTIGLAWRPSTLRRAEFQRLAETWRAVLN